MLVVDDEKNMRLSLESIMSEEGYQYRAAESAEEALKLLDQEEFFMVITDARLGGMSGYEFLAKMRQKFPAIPVLMITAYATPKLAVEAIKAGAIDYLAKPFAPEELLHAVARCAERHRLLMENAELKAKAGEAYTLEQIIGDSPKMKELKQLVQTVAPTQATVLILNSWFPPTRVKVPSSRKRSSFACNGRLMSPISSRKIVPPSASSTRPCFCLRAPVKAPFSCPNNSLSSSSSGMAAQLIRT